MKLLRASEVAQALLPAVSRLFSTLVPGYDAASKASVGLMVGRTPRSARDALVPQPEQRHQHLTRREQADEGVGRGPGGPPHHQCSLLVAARSACATRHGQLLRVLLLLFLAAPGLSQSEDEPYFSLSSARTFGAGAKASVALTAWNVDTLEFRVYRVDDPVQFFQQLESAHEFGGRAPRPPHQRTLLERIHAWKHGLRTSIRRGLRGQFTESPSARWENAFAGGNKPAALVPAATGTHYAEAPLLNSQQLVLTFQHRPRSHNRWESQSVDVAVKDRGVYLVEAVRGELRAYTILMVSDLVMVTKNGNGRIVNFLADRNTGEPVRGAELVLLTRDARQGTAESDDNGLAELKFVDTKQDDLRLVARSGPNFAVNILPNYAFETSREHLDGLYLHRSPRLPPRPHRALQGHPAPTRRRRVYRARRQGPPGGNPRRRAECRL